MRTKVLKEREAWIRDCMNVLGFSREKAELTYKKVAAIAEVLKNTLKLDK